ncbi:phosphoribosylformylglycinamidine synthase [Salinisphaera sp. Q1T1-3]|uniref:phosphoribosylformylglycinamidine synthase n=1 Tax=Salinisphaera sp. Q1T1-3 TaxID=2321229 RepID=UPI000E71EEC0|nr:phosphoribosylformylglycinamidine synthase [Salinisphaera sp. Q1T1-3]RJS94629.1 phosphoribosylformylglycinamidine synthase [Salinisphaera sp. Q1T1-3]
MAQSEQPIEHIAIYAGAPALAEFERDRLAVGLAQAGLDSAGLRAQVVYIAAFAAHADEAATTRLKQVLEVDGSAPEPHGVLVLPRLGTVSAWSTKAADIAQNAGVTGLMRLDRALVYRFDDAAPALADLAASGVLHDPMTESMTDDWSLLETLFSQPRPRRLRRVPLAARGETALHEANRDWGLALDEAEITYLAEQYTALERDPTDVELMMFGQINSEHCRHKIFNAAFVIDGQPQADSLFDMIRASYKAAPDGVLSAYRDNAAVVEGPMATRLTVDGERTYRLVEEPVHLLMKVETHNHPTAIAPSPGAATGAGGEIRDEAATGRGGKPKAGLTGFSVADLCIPGHEQPWETDRDRPTHLASALDIMLAAPIGAARYNNEFGRPALGGYFRAYQHESAATGLRGYHKPIMIAGGMGNVRPGHVEKQAVPVEACLVVLGGPAMLIGLGGGAASSMASGADSAELDFASVQRANPEMERRAQEVIEGCIAFGDDNPVASIHDVGAGGLSNALPEIIDADDRGGSIRLRDIHSADPGLSPMEIWCNESQERYVLAIAADRLGDFEALAARERCPYAVVGRATAESQLVVEDSAARSAEDARPVDMPMSVLLGRTPRMTREATRESLRPAAFGHRDIDIAEAFDRVLGVPSVASKSFLITIGDRSIGGMTARDQMVGPWQVPVADVAVTTTAFTGDTGEAMAMGERAPVALIDAPASGRMAVAEAITNIAAARIERLTDVRLSANWMAACGDAVEDARLYDTVRAVGAELCAELGLAIPVGKDSLSMRARWTDAEDRERTMSAPVSLVVSAFAPTVSARGTLTPQLQPAEAGATRLILADLGQGRNRLGGSALAQAYGALGDQAPDLDRHAALAGFFDAIQKLAAAGRILAYHDRSDGGLAACLAEMSFAGHLGVDVTLDALDASAVAALFAEELGAVLQVAADDVETTLATLRDAGVAASDIGTITDDDRLTFRHDGAVVFAAPRVDLHRRWASLSHAMATRRDEPASADAEYDALLDTADPGLPAEVSFDPDADVIAPYINTTRPRVAILREQGVNGHNEMGFAFTQAGFDAIDVHMSEVLAGRVNLAEMQGLAACGGFSYGDVLGAGQGWARSILFNRRARAAFADFFAREDTFALGVCNGCQMLSALAELIPGTDGWPRFVANASRQFEGRTSAVEILESRAVLLEGMAGSRVPVAVAHGEGRAEFASAAAPDRLAEAGQIGMRYTANAGGPATTYPANPNGSPAGVTGLCNADGRVFICMPHPERVTRSVNLSWAPSSWGEASPWARLFANARRFVG